MSEAMILEEEQEFTIADDGAAEWCITKIREAEAEKEMWRKHYEAQLKKVTESADSTIDYMKAKLQQYFESVPHKATKTQESYTLPGGKLIMKRQQPKFDLDEDALIPWLESEQRGELIKVKKSVDWATLKKEVVYSSESSYATTIDGEVIPGVMITHRPDVFEVKLEVEG